MPLAQTPRGEGEFLGGGRTKAERVALFTFSRVLEVSAMSGSQKFRLRLSPQLAAQVQTMAELWNVPFAAVLRLAVEELMADPDRAHACIAARYGNIPDSSTPEQRQRA